MLRELMKPAQRASLSRRSCVCEARHPTKAHTPKGLHHGKQHAKKKRDISTSFRKGPVPRPLVSTPQQQPAVREEEPLIGIPPPASFDLPANLGLAATSLSPSPAQQAVSTQAEALTGLSLLGEAYRIQRATSEPVIAAAAVTTSPPPDTILPPAQDLGLPLVDSAVFGAGGLEDGDSSLWADADPLASFDRVLDSLLVAPVLPQAFTSTKAPSTRTPNSSSPSTSTASRVSSSGSLLADTPLSATAAGTPSSSNGSAASGKARKSSASSKQPSAKPSKAYGQSMAAAAGAAAGPAVTVIHCETELERELQAAAALQQLLVLKVESSQHLLPRANDPSMRFQTHTNLPTPLNTYLMQHSELTSSSYSGASSTTNSTAELLASMGVPLGPPSASSSTNGTSSAHTGSLFGNSSSTGAEPFSPVHAWYKQLAAQYAHSAAHAGRPCPVRFLSLQSDSARARSVCRRLGVSAPLAVVLLDAASERKLQEVCGAKIEQELPNGLLYFGGGDPQGVSPPELLQQVNTDAELEELKSSSQLSVVAFHVHGAPPCVRSYARMYGVAQQYACSSSGSTPSVSFGVMDVDIAPEGTTVSSKLDLQGLPAYVIYRDGQEVARLSSSPDRRRLGEVLAQQVEACAAATTQHESA